MPSMVRLEHGFIQELGLYQITSPDIKGFYITAQTKDEAEREALNMLALIRFRSGGSSDHKLTSITFEAA